MPEGDTIFRTARTLGGALTGQRVLRFRTSLDALDGSGLVGLDVSSVESRGKNLLMHFSDGRVLYSHMRMTGSWHLYRRRESWRRPQRQARCALDTQHHVAVCFNAPVLELLTAKGLRRHRILARLGPDLLSETPHMNEILRRFRGGKDVPIGELVVAQNVVCGIGNVYKSESLFLEGLDPFRPASSLDDAAVLALMNRARRLMLSNLTGYPRITRHAPGGRYWAYGRMDEPCFCCGTPMRMRRQGDAGRSTYWCPDCQASGPQPK
ncbi:MAG: DNA-formamidopyrimidine glycosylase family protein [Myxococcota bacterium]